MIRMDREEHPLLTGGQLIQWVLVVFGRGYVIRSKIKKG